ncbi:MAG: hypothetical protein PHV13_00670 [Candidatus ainarchaeum sp.]|nr:hypothetical protein [Candidatus ainarchaeum sp.]
MHIPQNPEKPVAVAAAAPGKPRLAAAPLISRSARKITDVLQHKRVCQVLNDKSFEMSFRSHVAIDYDHRSKFEIKPGEPIDPLLLDSCMTITNMSVFLRMLPARQEHEAGQTAPKAPFLSKDLIILDSPVLLETDAFDTLEAGLAVFRSTHPKAVVIAGKPADEAAMLQMKVLKEKGLVDIVVTKPRTSSKLMLCGANILEQKLQKLGAALEAGKVALHCDPADVHETVLIESIQK